MPPRKRIFREDILKATVRLVREEGPPALSVRNIAKALNCSTQPIYSEFEHMDALREELMAYIRVQYLRENADSYKQVALSFLHFAQREKNLFQLVYLRQRAPGETFFEDPNQEQTIHKLEVNLELSRQKAAEMQLLPGGDDGHLLPEFQRGGAQHRAHRILPHHIELL